ncbi:DUF5085 family protein [Streptococcus equinus]|uniref:DUF5085 family protein n=1 Tax=Streptococcus equinus TaxID=1335 RepID=UPI000891E7BC|nr:DUF5085 family protein [Streptococcus equinus]SDJ05585.1 protein of unknown function [Streptococcus equinus]SEP98903.1 protein of unknown function [Streptococcus equinus]
MTEILEGRNQTLTLSNVWSVNYTVEVDKIGIAFKDALDSITAAGYTLKTDLFYSTPQVEGHDGMLDITVYLPVNEDYLGEEVELAEFNSYFSISTIYGVRISSTNPEDFDKALEKLQVMLIEDDAEEASSIFFMSSKINGTVYTDIRIGVRYE